MINRKMILCIFAVISCNQATYSSMQSNNMIQPSKGLNTNMRLNKPRILDSTRILDSRYLLKEFDMTQDFTLRERTNKRTEPSNETFALKGPMQNNNVSKRILDSRYPPLKDPVQNNDMTQDFILRKRIKTNSNKELSPKPIASSGGSPSYFIQNNKETSCWPSFSLFNIFSSSSNQYVNYPLLQAVNNGDLKQVRSCLNHYKDDINANKINKQCKQNGNSALHVAVVKQYIEIIKELLLAGINVNLQNHDGNTAFHLACESYNSKVIRIIDEEKSLDKKIKNNNEKTALEILHRKLELEEQEMRR